MHKEPFSVFCVLAALCIAAPAREIAPQMRCLEKLANQQRVVSAHLAELDRRQGADNRTTSRAHNVRIYVPESRICNVVCGPDYQTVEVTLSMMDERSSLLLWRRQLEAKQAGCARLPESASLRAIVGRGGALRKAAP